MSGFPFLNKDDFLGNLYGSPDTAMVEGNDCFSTIIQNTADAILFIDEFGKILYANPVTAIIFQRPMNQLIGKPFGFPLAGDTPTEIEVIHKAGETLTVEMRTVHTVWKGAPVVVITLRDISKRKQIEFSLRESEAFAHSILNALSSNIAIIDQAGIIVHVNQAWTDFAMENGLRDDQIGVNYLDICDCARGVDVEIARQAGDGIRRVLNCFSKEYAIEYPCHSPEEKRWFVLRVRRLCDETRGYAVVSHENITWRVMAEQEIHRRFIFEKAIAQVSRLLIVEAEPDLNHILEIVGGAIRAERIYIFKLKNQPTQVEDTYEWCMPGIESFLKEFRHIDAERYQHWEDFLQEGDPVFFSKKDFHLLTPHDREWIDRRGAHSILVVPIMSKAGGLHGSIGIDDLDCERVWPEDMINLIRVVAEMISSYWNRISAEHAMRESEERYRSFFEQDLTGDFVSTPDGRVLTCNHALVKMMGFDSVQALMETNAYSFYSRPEDRSEYIQRLKTEKTLEHIELNLRHANGKPVYVIANLIGHFDAQGELERIQGYLFDITEQKRLEERLRQMQKMEAIGRLAGGIAHDFNNLIMAIRGYTSLAMKTVDADDEIYEYMEEVKKAGDRGAELTRQLLTFSRKQVQSVKVIQLNSLIQNLQKMLQRLIGEDVEFETCLDPDIGTIHADPSQIEQILMNLVINARDAMPNGGRLVLETSNEAVPNDDENFDAHLPGEFVRLSVKDTGVGMDDETLTHIFEPFFTTKEIGKGTGLGLATIYGIVNQSGGHIRVVSRLNVGTTFHVYLPKVSMIADENKPVTAFERSLSGHETILLVEDDSAVCQLLFQALSAQQYRVLKADNGEEALRLCETHKGMIHLMITDVIMPRMSGVELAKRAQGMRPGMKIIFMSGYTGDQINQDHISMSENAFYQKPVDLNALIQGIRKILGIAEQAVPPQTTIGI